MSETSFTEIDGKRFQNIVVEEELVVGYFYSLNKKESLHTKIIEMMTYIQAYHTSVPVTCYQICIEKNEDIVDLYGIIPSDYADGDTPQETIILFQNGSIKKRIPVFDLLANALENAVVETGYEMIQAFHRENLAELLHHSLYHEFYEEKPILCVIFTKENCNASDHLLHLLEKKMPKLGKLARVGKISITKEPSIAKLYGVESIPTLLVFKQGLIVLRVTDLTTISTVESDSPELAAIKEILLA